MVALLSELDAPLASTSLVVFKGHPHHHRQPHDQHCHHHKKSRDIDFFQHQKSVDYNIQGFSFDSDVDSMYDVKKISQDVYLDAASSSKYRRPKNQKCKSVPKRLYKKDDDVDNASDSNNNFKSIKLKNKEDSEIIEGFVESRDHGPAPWQDIMLYAISGLLLLILMEQVFRLGIHVATTRCLLNRGLQ